MHQIIETLNDLNPWSVAFRILLAVFIGGCIGNNRERHGRAAGLRTHILVCLGAAMTTLMGLYATQCLGSSGDPMRVGAQVISGIGFLGVGTIMVRNRSHVIGLTTAAGLWATACIGLAIGVGFYWAVATAFGVIMITMTALSRLERTAKYRDRGSYYIELIDIHKAKALYEEMAEQIYEVEVVPAKSGIPAHVGMELTVASAESQKTLLNRLQGCDDVVIAVPLH